MTRRPFPAAARGHGLLAALLIFSLGGGLALSQVLNRVFPPTSVAVVVHPGSSTPSASRSVMRGIALPASFDVSAKLELGLPPGNY